MSTKVVVELTSDEERLINGFRKAEAADQKLRESLARTGKEIDGASKAIADSMIRAGNQVSATAATIVKQFKFAGDAGTQIFKELDTHAGAFGATGKKSVQQLLAELQTVNPAMAAQGQKMLAEWQSVDQAKKFDSTRKQLDALGGEFAIVGKEIRLATQAPLGDAAENAERIVAELRAIDPSKADAIARAMESARESINESRLDSFLTKLSGSTKEAQSLATVLGDGMRSAALEAEGGIDGIAAKIVALRPELSSSVEKWRSDMAEAARFGEGQYEKVLNKLRQGDSVSKQAAEKIREHLVRSGKIVEQTFEDMIGPLDKIDPKMAEQARKIKEQLDGIELRGKGAFAGLGRMATSEIVQIATAYVGVQEAIQAVTQAMQEQDQVRRDAANAQRSLATAQLEAFKNLSGLPEQEQTRLMDTFIFDVANKTGFSDLPTLATTVGEAQSAGATSITQLENAVRVAAELNPLKPAQAPTMAAALIDTSRATGNLDARQNASQLFLLGSESRVVDPEKVFRNVAPVQLAGSMADPSRRVEGSMQFGAIWAALAKAGTDPEGASAKTASLVLGDELKKFFSGLGDSKSAAKARIQLSEFQSRDPLSSTERLTMTNLISRKNSKAETDAKILETQIELAAIDSRQREGAGTAQSKRADSFANGDLSRRLTSLKAMSFDDADEAKLADILTRLPGGKKYEEQVSKLKTTIAAGEMKNADQLKTLKLPIDQFKAFQANPDLAESFLSNEFGDATFKAGFEQLVRGGGAFDDMMRTYQVQRQNLGSTAVYDQKVRQSKMGTGAIREATGQRESETGKAIQDATDVQASQSNFRETFANVMRDTRTSFLQSFTEPWAAKGGLGGAEGPEEIVSGIRQFVARKKSIELGGVDPEEAKKVQRLDDAINSALNRLDSETTTGFSPDRVERAANMARSFNKRGGRFGDTGFIETPNAGSFLMNEQDKAIFTRLEQIMLQQLEIQRQQLEANKGTQFNTMPKPIRSIDAQALVSRMAVGGRR